MLKLEDPLPKSARLLAVLLSVTLLFPSSPVSSDSSRLHSVPTPVALLAGTEPYNDVLNIQAMQRADVYFQGGKTLVEATSVQKPEYIAMQSTPRLPENNDRVIGREIMATVTAYNTVTWQTDSTPCIAAGGYICGRTDIVACPRAIPLGTEVMINEKTYVCMDRLALKYDNRFDISFDKDIEGAKHFGARWLPVTILQ